jgi:hypothetical protein
MNGGDIASQMAGEMGFSPQRLDSMSGMPGGGMGQPSMGMGMGMGQPSMGQPGMGMMGQPGMSMGQPSMGMMGQPSMGMGQMGMADPNQLGQYMPPINAMQSQEPGTGTDQAGPYEAATEDEPLTDADLGLGGGSGQAGGFVDNLMHRLRDPLLVAVILAILCLPATDGILQPMLPRMLQTGFYYLLVKAVLAGAIFFAVKCVIVN